MISGSFWERYCQEISTHKRVQNRLRLNIKCVSKLITLTLRYRDGTKIEELKMLITNKIRYLNRVTGWEIISFC